MENIFVCKLFSTFKIIFIGWVHKGEIKSKSINIFKALLGIIHIIIYIYKIYKAKEICAFCIKCILKPLDIISLCLPQPISTALTIREKRKSHLYILLDLSACLWTYVCMCLFNVFLYMCERGHMHTQVHNTH